MVSSFEPLSLNFAARLRRAHEHPRRRVTGIDDPSVLGFLCGASNELPERLLVVLPSEAEVRRFREGLLVASREREAQIFELPSFDVSPYSGLSPRRTLLSQRVQFLNAALSGEPGVFLATGAALVTPTLDPKDFREKTRVLTRGDTLNAAALERLRHLGYVDSPQVEDVGAYSARQGIVDIFSPSQSLPVRIELFGDEIDSLRFFDPETQRSLHSLDRITLPPFCEVPLTEAECRTLSAYLESLGGRTQDTLGLQSALRHLANHQGFPGYEFLAPLLGEGLHLPWDYFSKKISLWLINPIEIAVHTDRALVELRDEMATSQSFAPEFHKLMVSYPGRSLDEMDLIEFSKILVEEQDPSPAISYRATPTLRARSDSPERLKEQIEKVQTLRAQEGAHVFIFGRSVAQLQRLTAALRASGLRPRLLTDTDEAWATFRAEQAADRLLVHLVPRPFDHSMSLEEENLFLMRDEDFTGRRIRAPSRSEAVRAEEKVRALRFADLKPGDLIVHSTHGIGVYEGLSLIDVEGVPSEFIQITYKDSDRLYLPVYKIGQLQKFSGASGNVPLDRLGGSTWAKTTGRVRRAIRDVAADLLRIYAERAARFRPSFPPPGDRYFQLEAEFPYEETEDQARAIDAISSDLSGPKPMDRLVCGDVGFGKTEIAMRAAFRVIEAGQQVALVVPTTTLCFQHIENFRKRYRSLNVNIAGLSRFTPRSEVSKNLAAIKAGEVQIVIGTHRLFSSDVQFKNLGLLIIDEEHRFGVLHKEKLRKLRSSVDTLALSATPIPRTLNMSLVGIRDLSLINTPPQDRLPIRTFIVRQDEGLIKKAIESELERGGQVFFVHNRIQSIYGVEDELKKLIPGLRVRVGHGQMEERELEDVIIAFFHREFDVLLCTTIIESGIDLPTANTMIVDRAQNMGLSQLYQLRGRVGRSHSRAYCYLVIPSTGKIDKEAQERLRVLQENSSLGSGLKIAHYDLELRGAGDILGEDQSGHIAAVGYDLYFDLLQEAISETRGEPKARPIDPEINIGVPAYFPESYIPDVRIRLSFYKSLADSKSSEEMDRLEEDLRDRFGPLPDIALNLFGLTLIRNICRDMGVFELKTTKAAIFLSFAEPVGFDPQKILFLAQSQPKLLKLFPNNRLRISLEKQDWPTIFQILQRLQSQLFGVPSELQG